MRGFQSPLLFILSGLIIGFFSGSYFERRRQVKNGDFVYEQKKLLDTSSLIDDLVMKKVRVFCLVLTTHRYHSERAVFARRYWGHKCDMLVFASDVNDQSLGAMKFANSSDYNALWPKVRNAFEWTYNNHLNDFDWFLKADDDTFIVMENLKHFLGLNYSPNDAIYTGRHFIEGEMTSVFRPIPLKEQKYYASGGAGYVISRQGLKQLAEIGFGNLELCPKVVTSPQNRFEDVNMGRCLSASGVALVESRDLEKKHRFSYLSLSDHLEPDHQMVTWMAYMDRYGMRVGDQCCSNSSISFHYIDRKRMKAMDFLINNLGKGSRTSSMWSPYVNKDERTETTASDENPQDFERFITTKLTMNGYSV